MLPTRGLNAQDGVPDRVLERLLERHAPRRLERPVLEAGTDKFTLQAMIEARGWRWIGVHHAARLADEAQPLASQVEVQADLRRLPFGDSEQKEHGALEQRTVRIRHFGVEDGEHGEGELRGAAHHRHVVCKESLQQPFQPLRRQPAQVAPRTS